MSVSILDILKRELAIKRLTLDDISEKTSITRSKIHNYLSGRTRLELNAFIDICRALEISPVQIMAEYTNEKITQLEDSGVNIAEIEDTEEAEQIISEHPIADLDQDLIYLRAKHNIKSNIIRDLQSNNTKDLFLYNCRKFLSSNYPITFDEGKPIASKLVDATSPEIKKLIEEATKHYTNYKQYEFDEKQLADLIFITSTRHETILEEYREFRELLVTAQKHLDEKVRYRSTRFKLLRAKASSNSYIQELYEKHQPIITKYSKTNKRTIRRKQARRTRRTAKE